MSYELVFIGGSKDLTKEIRDGLRPKGTHEMFAERRLAYLADARTYAFSTAKHVEDVGFRQEVYELRQIAWRQEGDAHRDIWVAVYKETRL